MNYWQTNKLDSFVSIANVHTDTHCYWTIYDGSWDFQLVQQCTAFYPAHQSIPFSVVVVAVEGTVRASDNCSSFTEKLSCNLKKHHFRCCCFGRLWICHQCLPKLVELWEWDIHSSSPKVAILIPGLNHDEHGEICRLNRKTSAWMFVWCRLCSTSHSDLV